MTTILQSCLETQFIETTTVKLKVGATPNSIEFSRNTSSCNYPKESNKKAIPNHDSRGWSFLQVLSNVSSNPKETMEKENAYVHPLTRQFSLSRMSEKSLELCTENLGSETGSDIIDINILSLSSSSRPPTSDKNSLLTQERKLPQEVEFSPSSKSKVRVNNSRNFPPPLTTLSGSNPLQFRPHREDGRLVIQAVEAPPKPTYFQAERSHGRLRLSFHATMFDSELTRTEESEVDNVEDESEYEVDAPTSFNSKVLESSQKSKSHEFEFEFEMQSEPNLPKSYYELDEDCDHKENCYRPEEDDDDDDEEMVSYMRRDMDDNIFDVEVEMGRENFQRLMNVRCHEGERANKGLCNWPEPLWVATS